MNVRDLVINMLRNDVAILGNDLEILRNDLEILQVDWERLRDVMGNRHDESG